VRVVRQKVPFDTERAVQILRVPALFNNYVLEVLGLEKGEIVLAVRTPGGTEASADTMTRHLLVLYNSAQFDWSRKMRYAGSVHSFEGDPSDPVDAHWYIFELGLTIPFKGKWLETGHQVLYEAQLWDVRYAWEVTYRYNGDRSLKVLVCGTQRVPVEPETIYDAFCVPDA